MPAPRYKFTFIYLILRVMRTLSTPTIYPRKNFDPHTDVDTVCYIARREPEYYPEHDKLARITCHRTREQRLKMREIFDQSKTILQSYCRGDIGSFLGADGEISYSQLVEDCYKTELEIYLDDLHREFGYFKRTDTDTIVEIFLSIPPLEKAKFREAYEKVYGSLNDDLEYLDDDFKNIARELSARERQPEKPVDLELAAKDAHLLVEGISEWKDNRLELDRILMETPIQQLNATLHEFKKIHDKPLEKVIRRKIKHKAKKHAYRDMVLYGYNPNNYYARRIHHAVKGWGTEDHTLNRIISIQCEKNLAEIDIEYQMIADETLVEAIKSDTYGHQEQLLRCLTGEKRNHE